jgi:hypothetical protein
VWCEFGLFEAVEIPERPAWEHRILSQIFVNAPGANIATQSFSVDPVESIEAVKLQVRFLTSGSLLK